MEDDVKAAVFGNVGTMVTFRVGATDAEAFEKEFAPVFTMDDIVNLSAFQVYMRLMIDGVGSKPFSARTLDPIARPAHSYAQAVIAHSRTTYGKPVNEVTDEVTEFYRSMKPELVQKPKEESQVKVREIKDDTPLPKPKTERREGERREGERRKDERRSGQPERVKEPREKPTHFDDKPAMSLKDALAKAMSEKEAELPKGSKEHIEKEREERSEARREVAEEVLRKLIQEE